MTAAATAATPSRLCRASSMDFAPKATNSFPFPSLLKQTRAQVMLPLSHEEWLLARADAFIFDVFRLFRSAIGFIFIAGILLVSGRALVIGLLALAEKLRPSPPDHPDYQPTVTVLIPAYNEEAAILDTVRSVLASNYPKLEVLVIDDGSTDHTAELVRENFGRDPRVRLLLQPNRGKPAALNHGSCRSNRRNRGFHRRRYDCGSRCDSASGAAFR